MEENALLAPYSIIFKPKILDFAAGTDVCNGSALRGYFQTMRILLG